MLAGPLLSMKCAGAYKGLILNLTRAEMHDEQVRIYITMKVLDLRRKLSWAYSEPPNMNRGCFGPAVSRAIVCLRNDVQ